MTTEVAHWAENEGAEEESRSATARAKIEEWRKGSPAIANLGAGELSLLKQMIAAPEEYRRQQFFLICEFLDREEALDHVAAFYEANDLGMDTSFNVAFMFAIAACNEKGHKTNRVAQLLDSMNHIRYTANTPKDERKRTGGSEKSPFSG